MGSLLAFVSALSYSVMYFLVRSGVRRGDPDGGAFVTTAANVLLLTTAVIAISIGGSVPDWRIDGIFWFALAGLLGTFSGRILLFAGLHRIGPVRASSISNTAPIITIAMAVVVLGEELSPSAIMATLLVVGGLGILTWDAFRQEADSPARANRDGVDDIAPAPAEIGAGVGRVRSAAGVLGARIGTPPVLGPAFAASSALAFGIARATRRVGLDEMSDPLVGSMIGAMAALVASLVLQAARGRWSSVVVASFRDVRPRLWVAGACSTLGLLTFFVAIQLEPLAHVAVIASSETIITLVIGSIVLRRTERLTVRVAVPAVFVFAAGVLVAIG